MKIVLLPLDERPCNYQYPTQVPIEETIRVVVPPKDLLSLKKNVCDVKKISEWLLKESLDADYAIISLDTLLFGGIIPSRLHHFTFDELKETTDVLVEIKKQNPKIKIFCNELIMRCPSYSLSDEEPDYFDECGYEIFKLGGLLDKEAQGIISDNTPEKQELLSKIKEEYLVDFTTRRKTNLDILLYNLTHVTSGVVDFFVIPQDDCSEFGFPSMDQRKVKEFVNDNNLSDKIIMYPGADEIGLTLLARAINDYHDRRLKVYVHYASSKGKYSIPMFEDRPIDETIKYHLYTANCIRVYTLKDADICLGINLGSEFLPVWDRRCEIVYGKNRTLISFVDYLEYALTNDKVVGIADVAYCNQGDRDLLNLLNKKNLLFKISGYAGWNTSSNTIGTVLSNLVGYYYSKNDERKDFSLAARYLDDYIYMGTVRETINKQIQDLKLKDITRFDLGNKKEYFEKSALDLIIQESNKRNDSLLKHIKNMNVSFIWNRTFEIQFDFK